MDETQKITVKQYADHRGISRQRVYKYVNNGQLSKSVYTVDGKTVIDPDQADRELSENLDQIYNRPGSRPKKSGQSNRVEIQDQALDIASEGEVGVMPWPVWAARYAGALFVLDPDRVDVEQISKTEWRLTIDEINTETEQAAPWTVTMEFDFNPET